MIIGLAKTWRSYIQQLDAKPANLFTWLFVMPYVTFDIRLITESMHVHSKQEYLSRIHWENIFNGLQRRPLWKMFHVRMSAKR